MDQLASLARAGRGHGRAARSTLLVILGGNPVYTRPPTSTSRAAIDKVPLRVHLGLYDDETAERCHWHVPAGPLPREPGATRAPTTARSRSSSR